MRRSWLFIVLVLAACSEPDMTVVRVPKEQAIALPAMSAADSEASAGLAWSVPAGWSEEPASGMRLASFKAGSAAGQAEVSVVSLPGEAGGVAANVNRWRGQLGLAAQDEGALRAAARSLRTSAGEVLLFDISQGKGGKRMLAAILSHGGTSFFFKMTGGDAAVGSAKPAFEGFLGSLRHETR